MTRLDNFAKKITNSNQNLRVNKKNNTVKVYHKNINKNNAYSCFRNKGNTLNKCGMYTNDSYEKRKFQQYFLRAGIRAAKNVGYKRINAMSTHSQPGPYRNVPNSFYIFTKFGFIKVKEEGIRGKGYPTDPNRHRFYWTLNLTGNTRFPANIPNKLNTRRN